MGIESLNKYSFSIETDDAKELQQYVKAQEAYFVINEILAEMRNDWKYNEKLSEETHKYLDSLRDRVYNILRDYQIDIG